MSRCNKCNIPEVAPGEPGCDCVVVATNWPTHNQEHISRRRAWYKEFFGFYPEQIPKEFKMPAGIWTDPVPHVAVGENYIIYGNVGSGKSTSIADICWKLILGTRSVSIRGGSVSSIMHNLKGDGVNEYRKTFEGADVLVLDDLDKILGSTYEVVELFSLADMFFSRRKSVLVSMNPSPEEFVTQLKSSKYNVPPVWADSFLSRVTNKADIIQVKSLPDFRGLKRAHAA